MMTICRTRVIQDGCMEMLEEFEEEIEIDNQVLIDHECLVKYDQNNEHFSMKVDCVEEERVIYKCKYRYQSHEVKLEYDITSEKWKLASGKYQPGEKQLKTLIDSINKFGRNNRSLTLNEQVQHALKVFDGHFLEVEGGQTKKKLKSSLTVEEEDEMETESFESNPLSDDEQESGEDSFDHDLNSSIPDEIKSPAVAPRLSRENSVQYASVTLPPAVPVRRRRVIESIRLHVYRKKRMFEKLVDIIMFRGRPTMHDLGLEFLRMHDGKFNYQEGHTFVMSYRKKIWFLTIVEINCVDCPMNERGPPSVLILNYKDQYSRVHV